MAAKCWKLQQFPDDAREDGPEKIREGSPLRVSKEASPVFRARGIADSLNMHAGPGVGRGASSAKERTEEAPPTARYRGEPALVKASSTGYPLKGWRKILPGSNRLSRLSRRVSSRGSEPLDPRPPPPPRRPHPSTGQGVHSAEKVPRPFEGRSRIHRFNVRLTCHVNTSNYTYDGGWVRGVRGPGGAEFATRVSEIMLVRSINRRPVGS